jgi:hypothetical protein
VIAASLSVVRSLIICRSVGNLFDVLQAIEGHKIIHLAQCAVAENLTVAVLIAYLSGLCPPAFITTQYPLLSPLALLTHDVHSTGGLPAAAVGWVPFFCSIPSPWYTRCCSSGRWHGASLRLNRLRSRPFRILKETRPALVELVSVRD